MTYGEPRISDDRTKESFFMWIVKKKTTIIVEKVIELVVFENLDSRIFIYSR